MYRHGGFNRLRYTADTHRGFRATAGMAYNPAMRVTIPVVIIVLLVLLAACSAAQPTAVPAGTPQATATQAPSTNPAATVAPGELTLWLPDWMLLEDTAGSETLQAQITRFEMARDISVHLVIKPPRGPNGLLDALAKTYPVAPTLLPDLIALPYRDAEAAARQELLQPLENLVPAEVFADLYPFAQTVAQTDQNRFAVPFLADFEHIGFLTSGLSEPPLTWDVIIQSGVTYAFPAGGGETALTDALFVHYLSALGETDAVERDQEALLRQLSFYEMLAGLNLIVPAAVKAGSPAETWQQTLQGNAVVGHTSAHLWLRDRDQAGALRFGPIPTADGTPRYLVDGWALAIVTADPARQALTAALLDDLLLSENLAELSQMMARPPVRRSALALWPDDTYRLFLSEALEQARRAPSLRGDTSFAKALHRAALDVLTGASDSATATATAVEAW
ncbi:MAG: hypothetical protein D6775_11030 [Caldilineae bacterium]|nr:MAG: hypothetical protein D6775_11030 [Caldilineae bacterium]